MAANLLVQHDMPFSFRFILKWSELKDSNYKSKQMTIFCKNRKTEFFMLILTPVVVSHYQLAVEVADVLLHQTLFNSTVFLCLVILFFFMTCMN